MNKLAQFSLIVYLCIASVLPAAAADDIKIETYRGNAVKNLRPLLDTWARNQYREYPYLYAYQNETDYNKVFEVDPTAFVLFAERNGKKIALLQANALDSEFLKTERYSPYTAINLMIHRGYDPKKILYITSLLTTKEEHCNREMLSELYNQAVKIAKEMGKTHICYMDIIQNGPHPLKPTNYVPIEPWSELDVRFKTTGVRIPMSWPTLQPNGNVREEVHKMEIFITNISKMSNTVVSHIP